MVNDEVDFNPTACNYFGSIVCSFFSDAVQGIMEFIFSDNNVQDLLIKNSHQIAVSNILNKIMPKEKRASSWRDYIFSLMCGLTGSLASLFAKMGLQPSNDIYRYFDTMDYGMYINSVIRIGFISGIFLMNVKMVEYKIRSFALLGSSITVVIAFLANYVFNI